MDKFFSPKSVAVIGASNSPFNLGATITNALNDILKYDGNIYAVNKKGEDVGTCKGYGSVLDIEEDIDLAVVIINAKFVSEIIRECGEKGIKNVIIESAGFSEGGENGQKMQDDVDKAAKEFGIRILGPNCLGVLNTENRFCCFYGMTTNSTLASEDTINGSLSYVIQSGGVGALVMESLQNDVVKVHKMVSIGNKSDVDEADLIDYFNSDKKTKLIGMYIESVKDGRKLMNSAKNSKLPILVFKVGRTEEGTSAALSHTAGMANNDIIFDKACKQSGIIRLKSISELHSMPKMLLKMPGLQGKNIAMFTNSGAFGGISADILVEAGLNIPKLKPETQDKLSKIGNIYNVTNPIDLGPALSPQIYLDIFDILLSADEVDGILPVPNVWQDFILDVLVELEKMCWHYNKPAAIYTPNSVARILEIRSKHDIPVFLSIEEAVRALEISYQYNSYLKKETKNYAEYTKASNSKQPASVIRV